MHLSKVFLAVLVTSSSVIALPRGPTVPVSVDIPGGIVAEEPKDLRTEPIVLSNRDINSTTKYVSKTVENVSVPGPVDSTTTKTTTTVTSETDKYIPRALQDPKKLLRIFNVGFPSTKSIKRSLPYLKIEDFISPIFNCRNRNKSGRVYTSNGEWL